MLGEDGALALPGAVSIVVRGVPHLEWESVIVTLPALLAVNSFCRLCFYTVVDFHLSV